MEMIKHSGDIFISELYKLVVTILNTEQMPKEWQSGIITLIHKKGDRRLRHNYRGITLLNTECSTSYYKLNLDMICRKLGNIKN